MAEENGAREMRERYLTRVRGHHVLLVCPDQNDATTQLITHRIQMIASNWVGHVAVQPLQDESQPLTGIIQHVMDRIHAIGSNAKPALDVKRSRARTRRRAPFRSDFDRRQADAQWFPATPVRRGLAHSPARVALFRSIRPLPAMRSERLRPYRTEAGASRDRR